MHRNPLLIVALLSLSCAASGGEPVGTRDFLGFQVPRVHRFGLMEAQARADAQRQAAHGICGQCTFKVKQGVVWLFEVRVGYGGAPRPDIAVIEPPDAFEFIVPDEESAEVGEPDLFLAAHRRTPREVE